MIRRFFGRFGRRKVSVPSLVNLSKSQAESALAAKGLNYNQTTTATSTPSLNLNVLSQGTPADTIVPIGTSIDFNYYNYVAPPSFGPSFVPSPPQNSSVSSSSWNGSTVTINGTFNTFPTNIAVNGSNIGSWSPSANQITFSLSGSGSRTIQIYNGRVPLIPEFSVSYSPGPNFNPGPSFPGPAFPAPGPSFPAPGPSFTPAPPIFWSTPLFFGPPSFKSVGVSTLVRTPNGLVKADDLQVGDILLSADIEGFINSPQENSTQIALAWSDTNPNINITETTIVLINKKMSEGAVVINSDIFSNYHYILIKRDGIAKFVSSVDVLNTDLVYSYADQTWEEITTLEAVPIVHEVVSINCEPYDMFFTEKILTHDSTAI